MSVQERRSERSRRRPGATPPTGKHAKPVRRLGRRPRIVALVLAVVVGFGWLVTSQLRLPAETFHTPVADAYVSTAHPDANYGTAPVLRADATPKIRSYLRFRLDGLSGRIVKAELRLWSRSGDLVGYSVYSVASAGWDELDITSNNCPAAGKPVVSSGPFGAETWSSVGVTRLVQGTDDVTLALTTKGTQSISFDSRQGVHKPQLVVQTRSMSSAVIRGRSDDRRDQGY
jgi:hypothetical protein